MGSLGENRKFKTQRSIFLILVVITTIYVANRTPLEGVVEENTVANIQKSKEVGEVAQSIGNPLLEAFQSCYKQHVLDKNNNTKELWKNFERDARKCDKLNNALKLDIRPTNNLDETKWIVYPKINETLTMITLGIGNDTGAEVELKKMIPNIEFYGSDPSYENNVLYKRIGKYFPVAITGKTGYRSSRVLADGIYQESLTMNLNFIYFLTEVIKKKRIDILWIDTEGGEFEIMKYLESSKELKQNGISICQINMEVHKHVLNYVTDEKLLFQMFLQNIIANGEYIITKPFLVDVAEYIRIFLINVTDPECRRLYI